jgi:hypothetical protein
MTTIHPKPEIFNPSDVRIVKTMMPGSGELETPLRWRYFLHDETPVWVNVEAKLLTPGAWLRVDLWQMFVFAELGVTRLLIQVRGRRWKLRYARLRDILEQGFQFDDDGWSWIAFPATLLQDKEPAPHCDWVKVCRRMRAPDGGAQ